MKKDDIFICIALPNKNFTIGKKYTICEWFDKTLVIYDDHLISIISIISINKFKKCFKSERLVKLNKII